MVPGGTVVFFPSFAFLDQARTVWAASGQLQRMTEASRGGVFWEPRASREVEAALAQFAGAVESSGAAVLMSGESTVELDPGVVLLTQLPVLGTRHS